MDWAAPYVEQDDPLLDDFDGFVARLTATFGDITGCSRAASKLQRLRQGTRPVSAYAAEFQRLAFETRWNDDALIAQFVSGLSTSVGDMLITFPEPETLQEAIEGAVRCDNRLYERRQVRSADRPHLPLTPSSTFPQPRSNPVTAPHGRLTETERQRRIGGNLCLYCGQPGHRARDCPNRGPRLTGIEQIPDFKAPRQDDGGVNESSPYLGTATSTEVSGMLLVTATLEVNGQSLRVDDALVDSGASICFVRKALLPHKWMHKGSNRPQPVVLADGSLLPKEKTGSMTRPVQVQVGTSTSTLMFREVEGLSYPVILGTPWLQATNPTINWESMSISETVTTPGAIPEPRHQSQNPSRTHLASVTPDFQPGNNQECLPAEYYDFEHLCEKKSADKLPPHRRFDCEIQIPEDKKLPFGPIYSMSEGELQELKTYIDENLAKGFIRASTSEAGAPVLFVKKKDGSKRLCVDYRRLNTITRKNRCPLPLIPELLDRVKSAKIFTKLDLRSAYHLLRIKEGDEWKTAFRTRYGIFEYLVMPFGLTNAPATFQAYVNHVLREHLDVFVIVYLDDILIYSENQAEHVDHVKRVLRKLDDGGLCLKLSKCEFHVTTVEFLGYVVDTKGIHMDPKKLDAIMNWPNPKSVKEVQAMLGFANYYRNFIPDFATIATPLTALTKKDTVFHWGSTEQAAVDKLKSSFSSGNILAHPDMSKPFVLETDASNVGVGAVLGQESADGMLQPVAFYSRKLNPAETNYSVYDKELLAIVAACKKFRRYLQGSHHRTRVITDHRNIEHITKHRFLNMRQNRWSMFLEDFDIAIEYRAGKENARADMLSRNPDFLSSGEDNGASLRRRPVIWTNAQPCDYLHAISETIDYSGLQSRDEESRQIINKCATTDTGTWGTYAIMGGVLRRNGKVFVPTAMRKDLLSRYHDDPSAGHWGDRKTLHLLQKCFYWPGMRTDTKAYVASCLTCGKVKVSRAKPSGLLHPLEPPTGRWQSIALDFITGLPKVEGSDAILVVVDRFTKVTHLVPCSKGISSRTTAKLLLRHVFKLHGLP